MALDVAPAPQKLERRHYRYQLAAGAQTRASRQRLSRRHQHAPSTSMAMTMSN
jgi:hypothetical protein